MTRVTFVALLALSAFFRASAQLLTAQEPREYRGRLLSLSLDAGCAWFRGDFRSGAAAPLAGGTLAAGLSERVAVGLSLAGVSARYARSPDGVDAAAYARQFGDARASPRSSALTMLELRASLCLTPASPVQCSLLAGTGIALYRPEDYADGTARLRPRSDYTHALVVPLGVEAQVALSDHLSVCAQVCARVFGRDDIDAFDAGALPDALLGCGLGLRFHPFASPDYDQDMLSNAEEDSLGTNPYRRDSDDDRLSDYEEVRAYDTDPLRVDTDNDGLGDYREVMQTRTDPRRADSDGDLLPDFEETALYGTDPRRPDTDVDTLTDYEELLVFRTDPLNPDTDCDGLGDYAEVMRHRTNPARADSDGDGLGDYAEVAAAGGLPRDPGADRDLPGDGGEVFYYGTNPLATDSDGDGRSDAFELLTSGTDPLARDTDGDGLADGGDPSPLAASAGAERNRAQARRLPVSSIDSSDLRPGRAFASLRLGFDVGSADIRDEGGVLLARIASILRRRPRMLVEVRGHADEEGSAAYNQALSESRAAAVRDVLVGLGVPAAQLRTAGYGELRPLLRCGGEECRSANRRVEFFTIDPDPEEEYRYAND